MYFKLSAVITSDCGRISPISVDDMVAAGAATLAGANDPDFSFAAAYGAAGEY